MWRRTLSCFRWKLKTARSMLPSTEVWVLARNKKYIKQKHIDMFFQVCVVNMLFVSWSLRSWRGGSKTCAPGYQTTSTPLCWLEEVEHLTSGSTSPYWTIVIMIYISLCVIVNVDCQHVTFRPCCPGLCRNAASEQLRGSNRHGDQR